MSLDEGRAKPREDENMPSSRLFVVKRPEVTKDGWSHEYTVRSFIIVILIDKQD